MQQRRVESNPRYPRPAYKPGGDSPDSWERAVLQLQLQLQSLSLQTLLAFSGESVESNEWRYIGGWSGSRTREPLVE
jgi:hypothetical protein